MFESMMMPSTEHGWTNFFQVASGTPSGLALSGGGLEISSERF